MLFLWFGSGGSTGQAEGTSRWESRLGNSTCKQTVSNVARLWGQSSTMECISPVAAVSAYARRASSTEPLEASSIKGKNGCFQHFSHSSAGLQCQRQGDQANIY